MYEVFVRSYFIVAGFSIYLEDETDTSSTHCEFISYHNSGNIFDVEAKNKSRDFSLASSYDILKMARLLKSALRKHAENQRIIFANVNMVSNGELSFNSYWVESVNKELINLYRARRDGQKWPEAFFLFTNYPELNAELSRAVSGPEMIAVEMGKGLIPPAGIRETFYKPLLDLGDAFARLSEIPREFEALHQFNIITWQSY